MRALFAIVFWLAMLALASIVGRWAIGYTLYVWSAGAFEAWSGFPVVAQYILGLFGSEVAIPAAIISWIVQLFTSIPIL